MSPAADNATPPVTGPVCVVLTGNPNCGKTTLFNSLTGLRAKVGNYAGVTVERKEGRMLGTNPPAAITILDLPGTYSLSPQSLDERISRDVLLRRLPEVPEPALVVVVVDASNLERNLYYATQVLELGHPCLIALNMLDVAESNGSVVDAALLSEALGVPVIPLVASEGQGLPELRAAIHKAAAIPRAKAAPRLFCELPPSFLLEVQSLAPSISQSGLSSEAIALLWLGDEKSEPPPPLSGKISEARSRLDAAGVDWRSATIEGRYARVSAIYHEVVVETDAHKETFSDRLDQVLTHKFWGLLIFVLIMGVMFQGIFRFAKLPMDALEIGVGWFGQFVGTMIPPGDLHSLLVDGVIAGVGAVVVFLPQICLLFLFIGLLEDTGYMARAAFLMDRLMSKVGLHGKSFIPMLSSFACAIPGIMATRTIESPKDRLATILIAPLMSCSARLPVYTLLIAACLPERRFFGFVGLHGLTMLGMYLLGIVVALLMAWLLKRTLLKGEPPMLIMELPPYKRPVLKVVLRHMWDRSRLFLRRAGTVILGISILLWFLSTYPRDSVAEAASKARIAQLEKSFVAPEGISTTDAAKLKKEVIEAVENESAGLQLRSSFAGMLGRAIEPAIAPLGFDWKIGIGIVASFAAREVFVSTMSTVYNVGAVDDADAATPTLAATLKLQKHADGTPVYTPLLGITLMVFYVFALQCVSTVAVVRRETNSWKWPLFQWLYMGLLAWGLAFITWHAGRALGY